MASAQWERVKENYTYAKRQQRLGKRLADKAQMKARIDAATPTNPCARCCVRPDHHDEHGCSSYVEGRLRT